jgi:hypothetical protein
VLAPAVKVCAIVGNPVLPTPANGSLALVE